MDSLKAPTVIMALLVFAGSLVPALAQERIGSWTVSTWTDSTSGTEHPAIASSTDYGLEGQVIFTCDPESETGLTLVLEAEALAADRGDALLVGAKFDLAPEVGPWTDWTQSADGSYVRFGGDPAQLQMIVDEMRAAVSPVFMVAFGPVAEGFHMFVLESEGFDAALGSLPCTP